MRRRRRGAGTAWNGGGLGSAGTHEQSLRQVRSSSANFVEARTLRLLNQAQRSSGRLIPYTAPDRLRKETAEPAAARTDDRRRPPDNRAARRTNAGNFVAGQFSDRRVGRKRAGNARRRHRRADPALHDRRRRGDPTDWALTLVPRETKLREMVATIRIAGERNQIRDVQTVEADGDRTRHGRFSRPEASVARFIVVSVWIAGLAASLPPSSAQTRLSTDMSAFLPRSPNPAQQILVDQLREGVVSRLILLAIEGADPATLATVNKTMAGDLRAAPGFGTS